MKTKSSIAKTTNPNTMAGRLRPVGAARLLPLLMLLALNLSVSPEAKATSYTYTVLHNFAGYPWDGANPHGSLTLSGSFLFPGSTLYGMTLYGGNAGFNVGTVFQISTDGTGYNILDNFSGVSPDGGNPWGSLTLSADGSTLYGMTEQGGGSDNNGEVFKINTDGTWGGPLFIFNGSDGSSPSGSLTLSADGSALYGMTFDGGSDWRGTVFKIDTDGTLAILHTFTGGSGDFAYPCGSLTLSADGSMLYGMTDQGGSSGKGTVFKINTDGTGYAILHTFTGSDGAYPGDSLTLSAYGETLYGMTGAGGSSGKGVVFQINTNGFGYSILHNFTGDDGASPCGSLTLSADHSTLYGTAEMGGSSGKGVVFQINANGLGYTILHTFTGSDGAYPSGSLTLSGSTLYGTTDQGGSSDNGVAFKLAPMLVLHWLATPTIMPNGGTFNNSVLVKLTCGTSGATIRYTITGVDPTSTSPTYSIPFTVTSTGTVKAKAFETGYADSLVASATFTMTVETPTITPNGDMGMFKDIPFNNSVPVTLACGTSGATIHYTTTGVDPTFRSPVYSGPFTVNSTDTKVKAIAFKTGYTASAIASATFTMKVAAPTITPAGGTFGGSVPVKLACGTSGATIHYTTTGVDPTSTSPVYSSPFAVTSTGTVKAIAFKPGYTASAIASAAFTITMPVVATPTITPNGGTFNNSVPVTLACGTSGATIHYTTTGVDPTSTSPTYSSPFTVSTGTTVKAMAVKNGYTASAIASAAFTMTVATPTITPAGGTFADSVSVTLACGTTGAKIRYTTTGADPTSSSPAYSSAFAVTSTATVKAMAFKTGYTDSTVASAAFTITTPAITSSATATPSGQVGVQYVGVVLQATGGTLPYTWSRASGSLPNGLTLNSSTGAISGKPTKAGTFNFTVKVTDANHQTATLPLIIYISST
jgi:uncharacterized repeat protein (TIGR03803 family)